MRHYRVMSPAQRDAAADRRVAQMQALGVPPREPLAPRDTAYVMAIFDGQVFIAEGLPARKSSQFRWLLNGEPLGTGGAEFAWREIQKRRVPLLGARNLC